jgi:murein DD-endopeptidase MepM/ murein hydrolase activator NlpD
MKLAILRARADAARAAQAYTKAEAELGRIAVKTRALEQRIPRLEARIDVLKRVLAERAAVLYRGGSGGGLTVLEQISQGDLMGSGRVARLADAANESTDQQMKDIAHTRDLLARDRDQLKAAKSRQQKVMADQKQRQKQLQDALVLATADLQTAQARQSYAKYVAALMRMHALAAAAGTTPDPQKPAADPALAARIPVTEMVCPVNGLIAFSDDFGQPRSGWRVHQGNDIFALRGTPNVAVDDGVIKQSHNKLGGNAMWLYDWHGNAYYYAHMDAYEGLFDANEMRVVKKGEVIGYVGNTGNAAGGPTHTHFEIHPGNIGPVDPYPILRWICAPQLGLK